MKCLHIFFKLFPSGFTFYISAICKCLYKSTGLAKLSTRLTWHKSTPYPFTLSPFTLSPYPFTLSPFTLSPFTLSPFTLSPFTPYPFTKSFT